LGKCCGLARPEPTIKFSSEAVTDKVRSGLGFSGEIEEVIRSRSLNYNIASPAWERPLIDLEVPSNFLKQLKNAPVLATQ